MVKEEEMFYKNLGKNIAKYRKEQNLTQDKLANKIGIKQSILAYYETGKRRPPVSLLFKIANSLYIEIEDLLGIKKKKGKPGPIPKIQRRLEAIQDLPLNKQKVILELLDSFIQTSSKAS